MIGPLLLVAGTVVYAVVHSLLASLDTKAWAYSHFGIIAKQWYRLAYNLFALISSLPILILLYLLPDQPLYQIPFPWIFLGVFGQITGILIILIGILQTDAWYFIGLRQIFQPWKDTPTVMVTTGLYSWMRHPLYTGGLLLIWLMPRMTLNMLTLFILLTIYLIVGAKLEEKRLVFEFGDDYRAYQARVPMLLPFPWRR